VFSVSNERAVETNSKGCGYGYQPKVRMMF